MQPGTQYFYYVNALTEGAFGPDVFVGAVTPPAGAISSKASGGPWSSPATWVGNVVPGSGDNVTIVDGATVTIDTQAAVNDLTVGSTAGRPDAGIKGFQPEGGAPAVLKFGETGTFSLTAGADVTINSNGTFSTGSGNANQHVLRVRGNIKNDGVLDLSTNNDQAGAGLVFEGRSSNTFSGSGPVTDVRTITLDKSLPSYVLEMSVANFTVQGSTTDSPAAGYLNLLGGTFKISGNFTGNFRTFPSPNYQIASTAGFELNNPNYTVTAQASTSVPIFGRFKIPAGIFNVGTQANHSLLLYEGGHMIVEGGRINTAGAFKSQTGAQPLSFTITGGTITTCTSLGNTTCFSLLPPINANGDTFALVGGEIVTQNNGTVSIPRPIDMVNSNTLLRFGNEFTLEASLFNLDYDNDFPDMILDTRVIGHTLFFNASFTDISPNSVRNLEIGPGGVVLAGARSLTIRGESLINNGKIRSDRPQSSIVFSGQNPVYSGSGTAEGILTRLTLNCTSLTLNSTNNLRVGQLHLTPGALINSSRLTLGNNDSTESAIVVSAGGYLDSAPVFDLGTGGQNLSYLNTISERSTGFELNPERTLKSLTFNAPNQKLNIEGGDLTVTTLNLTAGEIATGQNKIVQLGGGSITQGTLSGELERNLGTGPQLSAFWNFTSGLVILTGESAGSPSRLSIRSIPGPLPGLLPAKSLSRHWQVTKTGDFSANLRFGYVNSEIRGDEANYEIWQSTGSAPFLIPFSNRDPGANSITTISGITDFTGLWGIGEMADPGPVSISGSVLSSTGAGIRNAVVQISGGNLQAPVTANTGQFGTYLFTGLQAGEVYTLRVGAKRYRFGAASREIIPISNLTGIDFIANPREEF